MAKETDPSDNSTPSCKAPYSFGANLEARSLLDEPSLRLLVLEIRLASKDSFERSLGREALKNSPAEAVERLAFIEAS